MVVVLWQLRGRSEGQDCRAARVPVVNASGSRDLCILISFISNFSVSGLLGLAGLKGTFYIALADKTPSYTSLR